VSKGQANLIEYVLTISFSVAILIGVTAMFYSFYATTTRADAEKGLRELSIQTADNILKFYKSAKDSKAQPSNSSSILISEIDLKLPSQISGRNYEMFLISTNPVWTSVINFTVDSQNISSMIETSVAKIVAKTTQDPYVTVEYDIPNIDVGVQGKSVNGVESKLRYYRYNFNGTVYDKIVLGSSDILVGITGVS
jgi:hypothetical protein